MRPALAPRRLRRAGTSLLTGAVVAAGLSVGGPAPAARAATPPPAAVALGAAWIERQLSDGLIHDDQWNFDDFGATIEAAYALDAGDRDASIASITAALEANAEAYTAPGDDVWAGSTGKLLSYIEDLAPAADPRSFGGLDLVAQLEGRTTDSGAAAGRIVDLASHWETGEPVDYSNSFGQAWAVRGLTKAGSAEAPAALGFLLGQQCAAGFFRLYWADPAAPDQTCDGASPAEAVPAVDTTATVVILLDDLTPADAAQAAALDAALAAGVAWIKTRQHPDGSFDGGTATEGSNANSTGLAARALAIGGEADATARAAVWLRRHQVAGLRCEGALVGEAGAIAYDDAAYAEGRADGIDVPSAGQWRFATIQALAALAAAPSASGHLAVGGVPAFLDGGSTRRVTVAGLAPGERGCARIGGSRATVIGDADGSVTVAVAVPDRTGRTTVGAEVADEAAGGSAVVLAATRLPADIRARVERRGTQRVVVAGLWAGERVVVRHDGDPVARGRATDKGRFVAKFPVGRRVGDHAVTVTGQFADRKARKAFRVVR